MGRIQQKAQQKKAKIWNRSHPSPSRRAPLRSFPICPPPSLPPPSAPQTARPSQCASASGPPVLRPPPSAPAPASGSGDRLPSSPTSAGPQPTGEVVLRGGGQPPAGTSRGGECGAPQHQRGSAPAACGAEYCYASQQPSKVQGQVPEAGSEGGHQEQQQWEQRFSTFDLIFLFSFVHIFDKGVSQRNIATFSRYAQLCDIQLLYNF